MKWSLSVLFGLILLVLILFKKCEEFKGGGRVRFGRSIMGRKFDIVDVVIILLAVYYLFLNK